MQLLLADSPPNISVTKLYTPVVSPYSNVASVGPYVYSIRQRGRAERGLLGRSYQPGDGGNGLYLVPGLLLGRQVEIANEDNVVLDADSILDRPCESSAPPRSRCPHTVAGPPGLPEGGARQASRATLESQSVRSPRFLRPASPSPQVYTRYRDFACLYCRRFGRCIDHGSRSRAGNHTMKPNRGPCTNAA